MWGVQFMEESNKSALPKKGYWANHKFHRISIDEVITEYCGNDVLE